MRRSWLMVSWLIVGCVPLIALTVSPSGSLGQELRFGPFFQILETRIANIAEYVGIALTAAGFAAISETLH